MSASEIVQQAYEAFGEGDMEKLASLMSDSYVGNYQNHFQMEERLTVQMILSKIV